MLEKIKSLGCQNDSKVMLTYQTYLELTEIERMSDVTCLYNDNLDVIYLRVIKNDVPVTYVPIHSSSMIQVSWMHDILEQLSSGEPKSVILVIRESDSSSVQYKITDGLVPPNLLPNKSKEGKSRKKLKVNRLGEPSTSEGMT